MRRARPRTGRSGRCSRDRGSGTPRLLADADAEAHCVQVLLVHLELGEPRQLTPSQQRTGRFLHGDLGGVPAEALVSTEAVLQIQLTLLGFAGPVGRAQ